MENDAYVMSLFESLGHNCEFGIAQRLAGIDPFGLFRFAQTPAPLLMRLLTSRFAGLGEVESTYLWSRDGEWMTADRNLQWSMHTWQRCTEIDHDTMLAREIKRLEYLRNRMLDLLSEASRTFVVIGCTEIQDAEVFALLRHYSADNRLLSVKEGVRQATLVQPGFVRGFLPRFAAANVVDQDTDGPAWAALCRTALDLLDQQKTPELATLNVRQI